MGQPAWLGHRIIIDEGDDIPRRMTVPKIASLGNVGTILMCSAQRATAAQPAASVATTISKGVY